MLSAGIVDPNSPLPRRGQKKSTIIFCDASGASELQLGMIGFPFGHS